MNETTFDPPVPGGLENISPTPEPVARSFTGLNGTRITVGSPPRITIALEPFTPALYEEALPIVERNHLEHEVFPELPLDVQISYWEAIEKRGLLRIYVAREAGRFVGYAVFTVLPSPRRRTLLQADAQLINALPEHRARVVPWLVRHAERALREEGVQLLYHSCPIGSRFGTLLELLGYPQVQQVHAKRLQPEKD